ncbi:SLC13 family permease [Gordonia sihwensis]|uniref:SLC13 family permease n=1 Tax=Gordonia sihwensis TaxID=173559 RepID=UPI0005EF70FC|nr:SLC13 family permease [Gordonia sihwensis]KJR07216.1 arsenic transporter [Gordonia sihwensis]
MAWIGGALVLAGATALVTGALPAADAAATFDRAWPVLLFVVAITVVAQLAAEAGVFEVVAARLGVLARGRVFGLWLLTVLLAVVCTAFLSLDTTAVLLTPVVLALARVAGVAPAPFALTTVWLANTASLLLPVSNLTNLLALDRLNVRGAAGFVSLLGLPAVCATAATVGVLWLLHRRELRGRFRASPVPYVGDQTLFRICSSILVLLIPLLVVMPAPWVPACLAALALTATFALRRPEALQFGLIPWSLLLFAGGLFLVAGAVEASGLLDPLGRLSEHGTASVWAFAGAGAVGANLVNNLPGFLLLEPATTSPITLAALLIGVNAGPLVTPWASLATLLWHQRLVDEGVEFGWRRYVFVGAVAAPAIVAAATLTLSATS